MNKRSSSNAAGADSRLRQQLVQARSEIADLQEELQEKNNLYLATIKERDAGIEQLQNAKESLNRFEALVKQQVDRAMEKERKQLAEAKKSLEAKEKQSKAAGEEITHLKKQNEELKQKILMLKKDENNQFGGLDMDVEKRMREVNNMMNKKDAQVSELQKHVNYLQDTIEDFMAENKVLRDMANVPANFGIDREKVKLTDREKIDDFKKLIRVLQEDNYRLEAERAKLKHMLKQQSMMYSSKNPDEKYQHLNLTGDQVARVDEFVWKLVNGEANEPSDFYEIRAENEKLKAQLEAVNDKSIGFLQTQLTELFNEKMPNAGKTGGLSEDQFKVLQSQYGGMKDMIEQLMQQIASGQPMNITPTDPTILLDPKRSAIPARGGSICQVCGQTSRTMTQNFSLHLPGNKLPEPRMNPDNSITQGVSHKFDESDLHVTGKNGEDNGQGTNDPDNAFLQLQLQEAFELIYRKDESLKQQKREIELLYTRIKKYLLMQDHLYKDFVRMENEHAKQVDSLKVAASSAEEALSQEKVKVEKLEKLRDSLDKGQPNSARLIELTKQNSLLEVNLIRMTRKYQSLEEQEKLLRRNYQNVEKEMTELQVSCMTRINSLKEWKRNATFQLKQLYEQLRVAVPYADHEAVSKDLEIYKKKNGDYMVRNTEYADKINYLQSRLTDLTDSIRQQRELQESKDDLDREFQQVRSRLESIDPHYRNMNQVYYKMVRKLKQHKVSILSAFEQFDLNGDGNLDQEEFFKALDHMGLGDLTNQEFETVMSGLDKDSDGRVSYKEFSRKLQACGYHKMTRQEELIMHIVNKLRKLRTSKSELFDFIQKDGEGLITRKDLKDVITTLELSHVSKDDIEGFCDYFYQDQKGGIDLKSFLAIFERYEKKFEGEAANPQNRKPKRPQSSQRLIEMKKKLFEQIDFAMKKHGQTLKSLFKKVDEDRSQFIGPEEFFLMISSMGIHASRDEQAQIFQSIDYDNSGQVNWAEFKLDFEKSVNNSLAQLVEEERLLFLGDDDGALGGATGPSMGHTSAAMTEFENQRKIASLKDKVKQAYLELANEIKLREHSDKQLKEYISHHNALRLQFDNNRDEYFEIQKQLQMKDEQLRMSMKIEDGKHLQKRCQENEQELVQTRAALLSYKSMHNTVCEQVKQLKIMHERRKDENESLVQTLRDIQSESIDKTKYGKLYYVVMLSRWQEAAVNKKYDMKILECKDLEGEVLNANQLLENKEKDHHQSEVEIQKLKQQLNRIKQELSSSKNMFLTVEQGAEFTRVIDDLTDERTKLEELYYKVRSDCVVAQSSLDEARIKAEEKDKLYQEVRRMGEVELSGKLVDMSDSIQKLRVEAMKAKRKATELEERENYLGKILSNRTGEVSDLEQTLAKMEKEFHLKEEQWRLRDNERQRQYINKHFADVHENPMPSNTGSIPKRQVQPISARAVGPDPNPKLEAELRGLRIENQKLQDLVNHKEGIITKINGIGDYGVDEQAKDRQEEQRITLQSAHNQESKEMADAAYQTIKTLNEMLEQKKKQLKTKEDQIDQLRKDLANQREKSAMEIMQLQNQVTGHGQQALANMHAMIQKKDEPVRQVNTMPISNNAEMQKLNAELDHLKKMLIDTQEDNEQLRQTKNAEVERARQIQDHCDKTVKDLQEKVRIEREKREKLAKSRTDKNKELIEGFHSKLLEQQNEIEDYKRQLKQDKMNSMSDAKKPIPEASILTQNEREIKDLKDKVKKLDKEIIELKASEKKATTAKQTYEKSANKDIDLKDKEILKLRKDITDQKAEIREIRMETQAEKNLREKIKGDWDKLVKEKQGPGQGLSYSDMAKKISDLEKDIYILEAQKRVVIAHNPSTSTFEYIGDPMPIGDKDVTRVDEIIKGIKAWLDRPTNDRLSVKQVFESMDIENFGEVSVKNFESALLRIGVKIRPSEMQILKGVLDPRMIGFLGYRNFVRELQGIPQLAFMQKAISKLGDIAVSRNLSETQFLSLIDPKNVGNMSSDDFQASIKECKAPDFIMSEEEVSSIFKHVTKAEGRSIGVKMNVHHLIKEVYDAVRAILIDKVRDSFERAPLTIHQLFQKYDKNADGYLEYAEINRAMTESNLKLESEMNKIVLSILDPPSKMKKNGSGKISHGMVKYYLESFGPMGIQVAPKEMVESKKIDAPKVLSEGELSALTHEQIQTCKKASRKILLQCHNNIIETVGKLDNLEEGIVNKESLKKAIMDLKVSDLELDELNTLCKLCDKQSKGYISTNKFIEQLYAMANESESDVILRRLCKTLQHQDLNLEKIMKGYDTKGTGRLDKPVFKKCLKQLSVAMSDQDILKVVTEIAPYQNDVIDVKQFCNTVQEAGKVKPLPNYISQGPKGSNSIGKGGAGKNPMGAFDAEKKYKKNLEALKQEIEEKTREGDGLRLEVKACHDKYNRLDFEKKQLEARLVDKHSKPPRETQNEADSFSQKQEVMQLKEQLFAQQEDNNKLRKTIEVSLKSEISRLSTEKDALVEKLLESSDEKQNLRNQINRLLAQPLDGIQKREELELTRQLRIDELEQHNKDLEQENQDVNQQLFKAEEKLLDLKFEKETYDLQYARLQKRIQVLEQYKLSSSKISAQIAAQNEEDQDEISVIAGRTTATSRPRTKDSVKVKMSSGKNSDLEVVVDSLKRVVDKLKTENEHLKRENSKMEGFTGKIISEKALRQKINNLEQLVQSYEMKEINLDEREKTIKKLIDANKQLREDMCRESDRYFVLEGKYKEVLVKLQQVVKENKKNENLVFGMTTGGDMKRYQDFLGDNE